MQACSSTLQPFGAALVNWIYQAMEVILHVGAHRTGTASFQKYMYRKAPELGVSGTQFWGPKETRDGLFSFLDTESAMALDRLQIALSIEARNGIKTLVVSDPNMLGTVQGNTGRAPLYPNAFDRVQRVASAFNRRIAKIVISTRSLDTYWCSFFAHAVSGGMDLPSASRLDEVAYSDRSWRNVICDVSAALPEAETRVLSFEAYRGRADAYALQGAGIAAPFDDRRQHLNASADLPALRRCLQLHGKSSAALPFGMGRWNPFSNEHLAALRERHADDMMWLAAGADGKAQEINESSYDRAGKTLPRELKQKGQSDEFEKRKMARPG